MAAIDDIGTIGGQLEEQLKQELIARLWAWLKAHNNDEVLKINWGFFRKTFRIRDLYPVFTVVLGADPNPALSASPDPSRPAYKLPRN